MATAENPDIGFAQVLITCHQCCSKAELFCKTCDVNLCKACVGQHMLSLPPQRHDVIKYSLKHNEIPKPVCLSHTDQRCDLHCQQCDVPVCTECIASKKHVHHEMRKTVDTLKEKKNTIVKETKFLEEIIFPEYKRIVGKLKKNILDLPKNNTKLKSEISKQGRELHILVDTVVNKCLGEVDVMEKQSLAKLKKCLSEFQDLLCAVQDNIKRNTDLLQNKQSDIIHFQSQLKKLRELPPLIKITPGRFTPASVNAEEISKLFGNLHPSTASVIEDKVISKITNELSLLSSYYKKLLDRPVTIATIYSNYNLAKFISCLENNQAWIGGECCIMEKVDERGTVLQTVKTKSIYPGGLAVSRQGDLLYTEMHLNNINLLADGIVEVLIWTNWYPSGICSTSSGDIVVALCNEGCRGRYITSKTHKLNRYSGTTKTQEIQYDEKMQELFQRGMNSSLGIAENRNGDICVCDFNAKSILILTQEGKLKSRYKGGNVVLNSFEPSCVATDSKGQILVSDSVNECVHVLNIAGHFLIILDFCELKDPAGISVDSDDRLWVVEGKSGRLKIIKYMEEPQDLN